MGLQGCLPLSAAFPGQYAVLRTTGCIVDCQLSVLNLNSCSCAHGQKLPHPMLGTQACGPTHTWGLPDPKGEACQLRTHPNPNEMHGSGHLPGQS